MALASANVIAHHHLLVVRRRLPTPRPDVVFDTNLSAVVGALGGCARDSRRRDCFWAAAKSRQLICGALTVVLAVAYDEGLAERIRAGGAGIPAFYTPSAVGTPLAEGKECREFGGRKYVLEHGLRSDFSLIKGRVADTHGNILYNKTARNFGPPMAMAGKVTIVQVAEIVEPGQLDPESIVTPGIFVDRVVAIANPAHESELVAAGASYP
jgi:preprotein translocase subunit Sec61beta